MGFHAYFSAPTPSFRSGTYRLASGVGFSACLSSPTPTPWVSTLTFLLPRPVSAPGHIDQLPGGLFCLPFTPYAHAMGFPACFSTSTPSFLSATYRLASGGAFLLAFLLLRPHRGFLRLFSYFHAQFPLPDISISFRGAFLLAFHTLRPCRGFFRLLFCSHAQINRFIKRNYEFSVIKSCIPFTQQLIYATLRTTHLSSF